MEVDGGFAGGAEGVEEVVGLGLGEAKGMAVGGGGVVLKTGDSEERGGAAGFHFGKAFEIGGEVKTGVDLGLFRRQEGDGSGGLGDGPRAAGWRDEEALRLGGEVDVVDGKRDDELTAGRGGGLERADAGVEVIAALRGEGDLSADEVEVLLRLGMHLELEILALVVVMDGFDRLLEADGDEEADADGGDVDEEVAPGMGGLMGRVNVEHRAPAGLVVRYRGPEIGEMRLERWIGGGWRWGGGVG